MAAVTASPTAEAYAAAFSPAALATLSRGADPVSRLAARQALDLRARQAGLRALARSNAHPAHVRLEFRRSPHVIDLVSLPRRVDTAQAALHVAEVVAAQVLAVERDLTPERAHRKTAEILRRAANLADAAERAARPYTPDMRGE